MKKGSILLLVFVLLLGTMSYAAEDSAYDLYTKSSSAVNEATSFEMSMYGEVFVEANDQSQTLEIDAITAISMEDEDNIEMLADITMPGIMENSDSLLMYYRDGFAFMEVEGLKVKVAMPISEFMSTADVSPEVYQFSEELIKDQSAETDEDGNQIISFTIDGSLIDEMPMQQVGSIAAEEIIAAAEFEDMEVIAVIDKDGNLDSMNMLFAFTTESGGQEIYMAFDLTIEILQINDVEIDFPDDLDEYIDFTAIIEAQESEE